MVAEAEPHRLLERVFREEAGRLTAGLVRLLGDFDLAEELVSEAILEALTHWQEDGVPERASSWLLTTAKRKGIDRLRRQKSLRDKVALISALGQSPSGEADDRLQLIFTCCHPVLAREAQIALTLRAVVGLTTAEIARAFVVSEETLARRITRAKRKIVDSGVPYRIPSPHDMIERLNQVLTVIYLVFNEGYVTTSGKDPIRRDLVSDAEWLVTLLTRLMPQEPEPIGLLALINLHLARWPARSDAAGRLVLLQHQDRSLWNRPAIRRAERLIERAASIGRPGPFQIEAAIGAVHCDAETWESTDWSQIIELYDVLTRLDGSPVVRLSRAIAKSYLDGPATALDEIDGLASLLGGYYLFHASRAELLRRLDRPAKARAAELKAIRLTRNHAERALMRERLTASRVEPGPRAGQRSNGG